MQEKITVYKFREAREQNQDKKNGNKFKIQKNVKSQSALTEYQLFCSFCQFKKQFLQNETRSQKNTT